MYMIICNSIFIYYRMWDAVASILFSFVEGIVSAQVVTKQAPFHGKGGGIELFVCFDFPAQLFRLHRYLLLRTQIHRDLSRSLSFHAHKLLVLSLTRHHFSRRLITRQSPGITSTAAISTTRHVQCTWRFHCLKINCSDAKLQPLPHCRW